MIELKGKYEREEFLKFIGDDFLNDFNRDVREVNTLSLTSIQKANYLGESKILDLQIFEFFYDGSSNKRVALTKDAFSVMRSSAIFKALAVFKSTDSDDWRFSLLTATPEATEKGKVAVLYSNPKRLSFFLGPNAKVNTPTKFLISKGKVIDFEDLKSRFSIEVVNKEFYKEISNAFTKLVSGMLKLPDTADKSQTNLEFAVRLIGRIIFCWFLKEKKNKNNIPLVPKELLSLDAISSHEDYYHNVLEPIFFEILNKPIKDRDDKFKIELYSTIPYLNGGLFSPDKNSDYYKMGVYQSDFYNNLVVPDEWIKELFAILETYNFTIDENTSYDEELSIDPEMLGRIFENLLAEINPDTGESARKSTGSYYTPRIIVDYMVDESLLLYLKQQTEISEEKLKAVISYELTDDTDNPLTLEEREKIVNALEKVKILDPACGSGAFPIGALQKIVFILQQVDPDGSLWFKKQLAKASPEFRKDIEKKFSNKEYDFLRKLGVIRECIYGVDIQPIATEISRLRCFLTLIVDEHIDDSEENRGIKPLPNLDFKFVTANSLIGLPKLDTGEAQQQSLLPDNKEDIDELKNIRDSYFTSYGIEREQLKTAFAEQQNILIKQFFRDYNVAGSVKNDFMQKITDWKPFTHQATDWFDTEWMFGIKDGFDIVIANPPYVDSENMTKNSEQDRIKYNSLYLSAKGNWDLFVIFIERGDQLLKRGGLLTYIVPNKLIGAKYSESIRSYMLNNDIKSIRDYSDVKVFKDASVYPIVFTFVKSQVGYEPVKATKMIDLENYSISNDIPHEVFYEDIYWDRYFVDNNTLKLVFKLSKFTKLYKLNNEILGAATVGEAYELRKIVKELDDETDSYKMLINTGTIDQYKSLWGIKKTQYIKSAYLKPIVLDKDLNMTMSNRYIQACKRKIIIGGMTKKLEVFLDEGKYIAGKSTTIILDNGKIDLVYLSALLNSRLISFWYKIYFKSLSLAGGYLRISNNEIKKVPIPDIKKNDQKIISGLANHIASLMFENDYVENIDKQGQVKEFEKQINQMIYKLYGLSEDEIKIVEGN